MRQALNEVVADRRFLVSKSVTPLEVAEHILQQAASGERDLNRLKSSAFEKLSAAAWGGTLRSRHLRAITKNLIVVAAGGARPVRPQPQWRR